MLQGMTPEEVLEVFLRIKRMRKFESIPPTLNQFISAAKSVSISSAEKSDQIRAIYSKFHSIYRGLWESGSSAHDQESLWIEKLCNIEFNGEVLNNAFDNIIALPNYRSYPPTLLNFMDILQIVASGEPITYPELAYSKIKSSNPESLHQLLKIAKSRFGQFDIRAGYSEKTGRDFELCYRGVLNEYFLGLIEINTSGVGDGVNSCSREQVITQQETQSLMLKLDGLLERCDENK
jgi:hypothetical protein